MKSVLPVIAASAVVAFGGCAIAAPSLPPSVAAHYTIVIVDYPGALASFPLGINDHGVVAGWFIDTAGVSHGYLWQNGSFFKVIDDPDAPLTPAGGSAANGINDRGDISGVYYDKHGYSLGQYMTTAAFRHAPQITHAFMLDNGIYHGLMVPGSATGRFGTQANGINNKREVVGVFTDTAGTYHGFVWQHGKFFTFDIAGMPFSELHVVNNNGDVTGGYTTDKAGNHGHGFVGYLKH